MKLVDIFKKYEVERLDLEIKHPKYQAAYQKDSKVSGSSEAIDSLNDIDFNFLLRGQQLTDQDSDQ